MTVKQLKAALESVPNGERVALASDAEGNSFNWLDDLEYVEDVEINGKDRSAVILWPA